MRFAKTPRSNSSERRALRVLALGPNRLRQFPAYSAGHRHLPSGQSRISGAGGFSPSKRRGAFRISRHGGRHGFAYDDDQWLGRRRLGVGGIEAEAALLVSRSSARPRSHRFKLHGRLPEGATATDSCSRSCRCCVKKASSKNSSNSNVPGAFQFEPRRPRDDRQHGTGVRRDHRLFSGDEETLRYLELTGRDPDLIKLVETYAKAQGMFRTDGFARPDV